ncbi:MAG: HAD-IC family P-type ATPase [Clostridia bacterium]|nr:HAD-IC family P-type ATPase [Clostridia bacterium]
MQWHQMTAPDVLQRLGVSATGLDDRQAEARRRQYGANKLREEAKRGTIRRFFAQFSDFMVLILLGAAAVSFLTALLTGEGDFADPVIILLIVVTDAIIGTVQEGRAEQAIAALQKLSAPVCRVRRNGQTIPLPAEEVTVGDIVELSEGDCVPADGRLLGAAGLQMDEAPLTGESFPVEKDSRRRLSGDAPLSERQNMVFAGTSVASGHGTAVITAVGMETEMGRIAALLAQEAPPQTPLQLRLAKTGKMLGIAAMGICAVIFLLGCLQQVPVTEMFLIAVSLAVAAIPEGLPAVVTIVLALGVRRIAAQKAIVRRLPAVETLGCATVICSDKTGTLTQNKMTVTRLSDGRQTVVPESAEGRTILTCGVLCSNGESDPTEAAILHAAAAQGLYPQELKEMYPREGEIPFSGEKKYMVTVHRDGNGRCIVVKGAPEIVLERCSARGNSVPLDAFTRQQLQQEIRHLSGQGLRVLAVARRMVMTLPAETHWAEDLCFVGLLGLMDPPRPEVRTAVRQCRSAGIRPVMITGDHALTAAAIADTLGIRQDGEQLLTGAELDRMDDAALTRAAAGCAVYARVTPAHKMRIVQALQRGGQVVAMTGDGVNDAPALRAADIGCAMGQSGTEVAKNAADMVLTDDCFSTIVAAVEQGRGIYANIRKAVHFLLSSNIGEITTVLTAFLLRLPSPLLAIQLLWVNLVTDSLPALALGMEPTERDVMAQRPVPRDQSLFAGGLWYRICWRAC